MPARKPIEIGTRFARLVVIGESKSERSPYRAPCRCDCGKELEVLEAQLRFKKTLSCGCYQRQRTSEASIRHGCSRPGKVTREYRAWTGMLTRCENPKATGFNNYGGRGIKVCERWHVFENFYNDIGPIGDGLSLERKDVNGNYEPSNVKLATRREQNNNSRQNVIVSFGGFTGTIAQMAERHSMRFELLYGRLRSGWKIERALKQPLRITSLNYGRTLKF